MLLSEVASGVADVPAPPDHTLKAGISLRFSVNASFNALSFSLFTLEGWTRETCKTSAWSEDTNFETARPSVDR